MTWNQCRALDTIIIMYTFFPSFCHFVPLIKLIRSGIMAHVIRYFGLFLLFCSKSEKGGNDINCFALMFWFVVVLFFVSIMPTKWKVIRCFSISFLFFSFVGWQATIYLYQCRSATLSNSNKFKYGTRIKLVDNAYYCCVRTFSHGGNNKRQFTRFFMPQLLIFNSTLVFIIFVYRSPQQERH